MWIRKDGATRRSAPFASETKDWSHEQEGDADLVDLDEEQPFMAHTDQVDGLPLDVPEEEEQDPSNRQEIRMM
eukprot:7108043-Prorocentrum_lima.AAC.1